jgi:nickel/cobalt transporter (NiCoT) family protein
MCLIDTTDGALMMTLYTSTSLARDTIAILYYSIVLTGITVVVATCIGVIQLLTLVLNVASPTGAFWDGVNNADNHFDIIGGAICGTFVLTGIASVLLYKPWRCRVDRRRNIISGEISELQILDKGSSDQKVPDLAGLRES